MPSTAITGQTGRSGLTDRVTDALREAIVTLELQPGASIDKQALMERFGVSRFPVAAALKRLELEKLVDIRPQSGSRVSLIRLSDVHENMFLRRALEAEVVGSLCAMDNAALVAELRRNLRYQKAAVEANDRPGFHRLDLAFHDLMASSVGYPRVRTAIDNAVLALDRVRRLLDSPRRHALTYDEHVAIVDAIEARDTVRARKAVDTHIDAVMRELEDFYEHNIEVFTGAPPR